MYYGTADYVLFWVHMRMKEVQPRNQVTLTLVETPTVEQEYARRELMREGRRFKTKHGGVYGRRILNGRGLFMPKVGWRM